jgi:hypothetical protein
VGQPAEAATWRIGDQDQPWRLYPVSFLFDSGESYSPNYQWGGAKSMEVLVDDDGDGLVDEDPIDMVDNDGDLLWNEDRPDGVDNDKDGLVDEDGVDPQVDNDGDGLLNEDARRTGGTIFDLDEREAYRKAPFRRRGTAEEATGDTTKALGYGWGDDDWDSYFNEDAQDGADNDGDGLVDEDGTEPPPGVPRTWQQPVFAYGGEGLTQEQRQALQFAWDEVRKVFAATGPVAEEVVARLEQRRLSPTEWICPVRANSTRNLVALVDDRFLSGIYKVDPLTAANWDQELAGTGREGESGWGQNADGNIFTARAVSLSGVSHGFLANLSGLFYIDLLHFRPRPDFPDRTPTDFDIYYGGDKPTHYAQRYIQGELQTRLNVSDFIIPRQRDLTRPAIKDYRFEESGRYGPPPKVRVISFRSTMVDNQIWELAEFEVYGHGYSMDASYMTEIIDVGPAKPRFRRYFDTVDRTRPVTFESVQTLDDSRNNKIERAELAATKLNAQFDTAAVGQAVTWGQVRWKGKVEGRGGNVLVRVRAGTSLDLTVYNRKVGGGLMSPYIAAPLVADWPAQGTRLDAYSYAQMTLVDRPGFRALPSNTMSDRDGIVGGWTPWSAPYNFEDGRVDENGEGGVMLSLPPLTRYVQFRFDFVSTEESGVSLDWLEVEYSPPVASRGVVAEIYPDRAERLGETTAFQYVLKPNLATADIGFNRIDMAVPSLEAQIDSFLVDDLLWARLAPGPGVEGRAWLDSVKVADRQYAAATFVDRIGGATKLGIKTRLLTARDFPRGQEKDIRLDFHTPVYKLMTQFDSWVWNDGSTVALPQPTQAGNAVDRLPSDQVVVTVQDTDKSLALRQVSPNPFSPNGDGINDVARFQFDLYLLTKAVQVEVGIYDLSGRLMRRLGPVGAAAGEQQLAWDGRDEGGTAVAPGVYVYQLTVDSDTRESKTVTGTIGVAY